MKIPEFIPFHFDKFNSNLFKRQGAEGVGRWCMIRKAVAEMPQLYIDLNDPSDREGLELDTDSTPEQLTAMLDLAAQRGMIDADLYASGILWIENLETDLGRFYQTGKRNLPKKPTLQGKIPPSDHYLMEKFHEVEATTVKNSDKSGPLQGIPTHETKRNETNETNEVLKTEKIENMNSQTPISDQLNSAVTPWRYIKARKSIQAAEAIVKYTLVDTEQTGEAWSLWVQANKQELWDTRDIRGLWASFEWYINNANNNAKKYAAEKAKPKPPYAPEIPKMNPLKSAFD